MVKCDRVLVFSVARWCVFSRVVRVREDMRPSIGAYGLKEAVTPNLDQLAKEGVMFTRAHIQFSYCAPSRNSFM
jgi:hypothetical protein